MNEREPDLLAAWIVATTVLTLLYSAALLLATADTLDRPGTPPPTTKPTWTFRACSDYEKDRSRCGLVRNEEGTNE